jgi:uncharacterized protein YijF (DUF1287 family)
MTNYRNFSLLLFLLLLTTACRHSARTNSARGALPESPKYKTLPANSSPELQKLVDAAVAQAAVTTGYDPAYASIAYPNGDVPINTGVCSDVVIRAFRKIGVDLQKEVHEDMSQAFDKYPQRWGLRAPDSNIDHRRVPNLMTYFNRHGKSLPITDEPDDYLPGDIVAWDLGGGTYHIGMVTNMLSETERECLIVHNIGGGTRVEDVLLNWPIKGHYRYFK